MDRREALSTCGAIITGSLSGCVGIFGKEKEEIELKTTFSIEETDCSNNSDQVNVDSDGSVITISGAADLQEGCYSVEPEIQGPSEKSGAIASITFEHNDLADNCLSCAGQIAYSATIKPIQTTITNVQILHDKPDGNPSLGTHSVRTTSNTS